MEGAVQVTFRLEPAELGAAMRLLGRGLLRRTLPIAGVLLVLPAVLLFTPARSMAYGLWAALLVLVLGAVRFVLSTRASLRSSYERLGEALYRFDDAGVTIHSPGGSFALPWSAFVDRRADGAMTILRQAGGTILVLPERAFTPAQREALSRHLQALRPAT